MRVIHLQLDGVNRAAASLNRLDIARGVFSGVGDIDHCSGKFFTGEGINRQDSFLPKRDFTIAVFGNINGNLKVAQVGEDKQSCAGLGKFSRFDVARQNSACDRSINGQFLDLGIQQRKVGFGLGKGYLSLIERILRLKNRGGFETRLQ